MVNENDVLHDQMDTLFHFPICKHYQILETIDEDEVIEVNKR